MSSSSTSGLSYPHNRVIAERLNAAVDACALTKPQAECHVLVLLSGGIDSVAVLANVLVETRFQVHVHHVVLKNRDHRALAEDDAVADVVDYCWRHFRDFRYSSSSHEFRVHRRGYDLVAMMSAAAMYTMAAPEETGHRIDLLMSGHFLSTPQQIDFAERVFDGCSFAPDLKPRWIKPLDGLETDGPTQKYDIYNSVPPELAELGWSCRRPVRTRSGYKTCGKCYACANLTQARVGPPK